MLDSLVLRSSSNPATEHEPLALPFCRLLEYQGPCAGSFVGRFRLVSLVFLVCKHHSMVTLVVPRVTTEMLCMMHRA